MRRRLAIAAAGLTSAVVLAFCVPLGLVVRFLAVQRAVDSAELESRSVAAVLANVHEPSIIKGIVAEANASSSTPVTVYLPDGTVVGQPQPAGPLVDMARKGRAFTTTGPHGSRDVYVPVRGSSVDEVSVVRVSAPASLLHRGVARSWAILAGLAVLLLTISLALADRMARAVVGPVEQLVTVTERLREGDLAARSLPAGPPEIAEVAVAVNLLADRIVDLIAAERERAADLSHRLRTPLTALRLDAESVSDPDGRTRLAADIDFIERAMAQIIRDARRAAPRHPRPPEADLEAVIHDRMAFWAVLAEDQGRSWSVDLADQTHRVSVAREDLDAALDALLANVFAHTPEGTGFSVGVRTAPGGRSLLVVEDDGPGIADQSASERGRTGRLDGLGTGLGLDIARRTAEGAGGAFRVLAGSQGGCRVELELVTAAAVGAGARGDGEAHGRERGGRERGGRDRSEGRADRERHSS
jgi:signal transduction histidine kinase